MKRKEVRNTEMDNRLSTYPMHVASELCEKEYLEDQER